MAKRYVPPVIPYERYFVRWYNDQWEEVPELCQGPLSYCGVCRAILDYCTERDFLQRNPDVVISRYRNIPFMSVEVFIG